MVLYVGLLVLIVLLEYCYFEVEIIDIVVFDFE